VSKHRDLSIPCNAVAGSLAGVRRGRAGEIVNRSFFLASCCDRRDYCFRFVGGQLRGPGRPAERWGSSVVHEPSPGQTSTEGYGKPNSILVWCFEIKVSVRGASYPVFAWRA
jgi:hypothetical protein